MSGIGPITIDKSALQSFNPDEALWFDWFYKTNITPLFYVETLADLNKQMRDGRTSEQVVGNIAYKTPVICAESTSPSIPLLARPSGRGRAHGAAARPRQGADGQHRRSHWYYF